MAAAVRGAREDLADCLPELRPGRGLRVRQRVVVARPGKIGAFQQVGETFENVIGRDFAADGPWEKMGTDVTEFKQPWGKAYFAP